jgi:hypothetical protein
MESITVLLMSQDAIHRIVTKGWLASLEQSVEATLRLVSRLRLIEALLS